MTPGNNFIFRLDFLRPKYWSTWLLLLLLRSVHFLPRRRVLALGQFIGDRFLSANTKRRHIVEVNLKLCFPDHNEEERAQLMRDHFRAYGCSMLDQALVFWGSDVQLNKLISVSGVDEFKSLISENKVIVMTLHMTTVDFVGMVMTQIAPCTTMMKRENNPVLNWHLAKGRDRFLGSQVIYREQGLRPLIRGIKEGKICNFVPDEDFGDTGSSVFAPFFGIQTSTLTTVSRLAKITQAVVVPAIIRLDIETGQYQMDLSGPMANFPGPDPLEDAARINEEREKLIRQVPAQYLWTFRWFKTRPNNVTSPYDT